MNTSLQSVNACLIIKGEKQKRKQTQLQTEIPTILSHISLASFLWDISKQCKTRLNAAKAVSDQVLHCLQTKDSFKIGIKMKNTT